MPPDIVLLDVFMYGTLTLVTLLWSGYHRKFSVLLPLLFFIYLSLRYLIDFWIIYYTVLTAADVYLFVTSVEENFGGNVGG